MRNYISIDMVKAAPAVAVDGRLYDAFQSEIPRGEKNEFGYKVCFDNGAESFCESKEFEKFFLLMDRNMNLKTDKPSISERMVDSFIARFYSTTVGDKTTVVRAVLVNGFEIVESSSCVSPENYDPTGAVKNAAQAAVTGNYNGYGYFDPNLDYAALIAAETDPTRRAQLMQERENKIAYLNGTGQNPNGYTNAIYGQTTQQTVPVTQEAVLPEYVGQTQEELQAAYDKIAALQEQAIQNQLSMTQAQLQAAQQTANSEYDDLAREAYINMRLGQNALPQQLSALGISGGGSESANLKLQTNYQNNLHSSEQQRAQMLKDFALQGLQAQTQANSDIANINANAAQNAMNAWQNEQANQNNWNQWLANFQMQQQQYKDSLSRYEYEKQQAELAQAIELAQLTGDYSRLKAMGYDTSYMEQVKDANLKQMALEALYTQAQTAKVNGSVTKGSGGGTKKSSGGGGSSRGGSAGENVKAEQVLNTGGNNEVSVSGMMKLQNMATMGGTDNPVVANAIKKMLESGEINEATYNAFVKSMK